MLLQEQSPVRKKRTSTAGLKALPKKESASPFTPLALATTQTTPTPVAASPLAGVEATSTTLRAALMAATVLVTTKTSPSMAVLTEALGNPIQHTNAATTTKLGTTDGDSAHDRGSAVVAEAPTKATEHLILCGSPIKGCDTATQQPQQQQFDNKKPN
mmetsp:Transcript_19506/g.38611  ORF Transcript_19506/g.38611 Transcript_19506/m.38611 type:complete len:158 (-) Transcript_19506:1600-2073(-)